ncbi:conserved Plasmodium protein, unknown function [Plasmodium vivax]|uniref:C2H2-type domain-containing protein n=1 Tax=Plasmodium vivax TaxID=5855 RepID=A0A564ZP99_PLAVI|nr:conserved Plasmodium protein, unknown function [Plasmodium vivax]
MSHEWSDALEWRGNNSLESGREEEEEEEGKKKKASCYELINDKIFVYRCNACLLVFTCVHSFSNHVVSENHQIKQLNSLKRGKTFGCLRCKYVCLSVAKIISHIETFNHGHNILRKIKRNMVYNGIAFCSCRVKCYTFYSQNKYCLTTGDPLLAEHEGVPNLQPSGEGVPNLQPTGEAVPNLQPTGEGGEGGEGGMRPYDQSDSHHGGDVQFLPEGGWTPKGGSSLRRKTLGFILSTTGGAASNAAPNDADGAASKETDSATSNAAPNDANGAASNAAPMPCNQVGEQAELSPICTDLKKINDFNAVLLNLEKQEKQEKQRGRNMQGAANQQNGCTTDESRNLLLHIYENNYHLDQMSRRDSSHQDAHQNEKKCDALDETEGQLFSPPVGLNGDNAFAERENDPLSGYRFNPLSSYRFNPFEQGDFSLFPREDNTRVGTPGGEAPFFTHQGDHPQSGANNPDRKDTIRTSTTYSTLHEEGPSHINGGRSTRNKSSQNRPPNYEPIFKDHHKWDQFLSSEVANKIDQNLEGEMDEVKNSFLRSIQNSAKKLAALDALYLDEQMKGASLFCTDPPTACRSGGERHTNVGDEIGTNREGTPSGMPHPDEQQMGGFLNEDKFSPSEEDLKKYFCKNLLSHIFDYQPSSVVPTMGGSQRVDSGEPFSGKVAKAVGNTHWDVVTANNAHNMAERETPNRDPFTDMEYLPREGAADAAQYQTRRIDSSGSFLSPKYWQSQMDEMNRGDYNHMGGKDNREVSGSLVGATNQLGYTKHTVGRDKQRGDPHDASLFPPIGNALTYMKKKRSDNATEEREKKHQLDLLNYYRVQGGRSPYAHGDVQNGEGGRCYPQLNKASQHSNQPYEDLTSYRKCFGGWVAEEKNCKGENPLSRHAGPVSFTANAGVAVAKGMHQLGAPSPSGANFNERRLSQPSRRTSVSNPTDNAASPTQEQILNSIFEDPCDDKKICRTPSETDALNKKRQSFIDEIGEIKKSIEREKEKEKGNEKENNRPPTLTHMDPPYGQRMTPAIPLHSERSDFFKSGVLKKPSFYLGSRNNDGRGAYPDFKSIRANVPRGAGAHSGIPTEGGNFGSGHIQGGHIQGGHVQSGHFQNGYFQSSHLDSHLDSRLDNRRDHFSRTHQERKKSADGEYDQRFSSNLSKWQRRR